jgi:hypothetical protein
MSNRDGRRAKRKKGEKLSMAKAGDACPRCAAMIKKKRKTQRKLKLDKDGHAKPTYYKISKLSRAYCANRLGHEHHVHCHACHWTNF